MDHKDLETWKLSMNIVSEVYQITKKFPKSEIFGLVDQMRRSAVSIPSNIAEGSARNSDKEMMHFLYIALGSRAELETQIIIASDLSYLGCSQVDNILNKLIALRKSLLGLINYLKSKTTN